MELSFTTSACVSRNAIWNLYADVNKWRVWDADVERISLDGEFRTGSSGIVKMKSMSPMEYTLVAVEEGWSFWDKTSTPFGEIVFGHEIYEEDSGQVQIRHTVRLEDASNNPESLGFLRGIFSDVPDAVTQLVKAASEQ